MWQVAPHVLWVGHAGDGTDFRRVFDLGIRAVVQVAAEEPPPRTPRDLVFCRFPLVDGPGNDAGVLSLAVETVSGLLRRRVPTLVCCGAGLSRSPTVAAAALSLAYGELPDNCLQLVAAHRRLDVAPGLWHEIQALLQGKGR
jgi:protein-tyrosine phosphatase